MTESIISCSPPPYDTSEDIAVNRSAASTFNPGSVSSSPHILPNPAPVVLSRPSPTLPEANVQLYDPHGARNITTSSPSSQRSQPSRSLEPFGRPPGYVIAGTPTTNMVYLFSNIGDNAMLLIPAPNAPDTRPKYHISVGMNCFIPSSYITTIRRGATQEGPMVGDFEMGIADKTATLSIGGNEFPIGDVLGKSGPRRRGLWDWKFVNHGLFWDCKKNPRMCFSFDKKMLFAIFTPVTNLRQPGTPAELPQLEVTPQGQPFFDDILMSIMIIERWRLTPTSGGHKRLFN
ncbi:hypothetical protein IW261DRAFT_1094328 [Armillaria novae-zelandiae]|uniref:Uncharacterized protein n=1 Tax=Armillaria novae-zelandiae TaxID=153914 RepID=A0AA39UA35_9AGAR|nr:hypothetical protein IW261DRAFT_1094328 [Armillaria novae-zelandiae]